MKATTEMRGVPWKPYMNTDNDKIHIRIPTPAEETEDERRARAIGEPDYRPRTFKIEKRDVLKYGQTPNCMGWHNQMNGLPHKAHTPLCRERLSKLMMQDPLDCYRIANALHKEYAFQEQALRRTHIMDKNEDDTNLNNEIGKQETTTTTAQHSDQ